MPAKWRSDKIVYRGRDNSWKRGSSVSMRLITVIARRTQPCEALFFTRARKLHTNCRRTDFWRGMVRLVSRQLPLRSTATLAALPAMSLVPLAPFAELRRSLFRSRSEKWRRGELNPCPRRYPRKHLHVYPVRFLRSRRCTGTLPTSERPRISFTVRRGRSAVRLACCPRLAP